jgi:hypothetical protein
VAMLVEQVVLVVLELLFHHQYLEQTLSQKQKLQSRHKHM